MATQIHYRIVDHQKQLTIELSKSLAPRDDIIVKHVQDTLWGRTACDLNGDVRLTMEIGEPNDD